MRWGFPIWAAYEGGKKVACRDGRIRIAKLRRPVSSDCVQWFFALADGAPSFREYGDMVKVAVHTAQERTRLEPHFLYDGAQNELTQWLEKRGARVIACQSSFADKIAEIDCYATETSNHHIRRALQGILLRVELPRLSREMKLDDRILYTDCDVFFRDDVVSALSKIPCNYFAVAAEHDPKDYRRMNTGVMLMNLPALLEVDEELKSYIRQNFVALQNVAWDQGAYRHFFARGDNYLWNKLPPEFNWKPYWGDNPLARIIHFHGPKPFQRIDDAHFPELKHLTGGAYSRFCSEWRNLLQQSGSSRDKIAA
jgi:lipopolysaccharide biosynthesis glycosyltransferase